MIEQRRRLSLDIIYVRRRVIPKRLPLENSDQQLSFPLHPLLPPPPPPFLPVCRRRAVKYLERERELAQMCVDVVALHRMQNVTSHPSPTLVSVSFLPIAVGWNVCIM